MALSVLLAGAPSGARAEGLLTARRAVGVAFLGGSIVLAQKARDLDHQGDRLYRRYKQATDETEIERLYQRTSNRDVKSQVSWALSAACALSGLRLLLADGPSRKAAAPSGGAVLRQDPGTHLRLQGEVDRGTFRLRLGRAFY